MTKTLRITALFAITATSLSVASATLAAPTQTEPQSATSATLTDGLLTEPFLQNATADAVSVVWFTEKPGRINTVFVGGMFPDTPGAAPHMVPATTTKLSRMAEDAKSSLPDDERPAAEDGIVARDVYRHEARVTGLKANTDVPYQVMSTFDGKRAVSPMYTLAPSPTADQGSTILLTSDHQAKDNSPANLQWAKKTLGDIDAVFVAGDLVNVPDRASEWFDSANQKAYFPGLQGTAAFKGKNGNTYTGGAIIQNAPMYTAIGNHEVMGRIDGATSLNKAFNAPVPHAVAEAEYEKVAAEVNPSGDPAVKAQWIENNAFSSTSYEEIMTMPTSEAGGERYYATTVGNTRLITLYVTRIWRNWTNNENPADRKGASRYQEAASTLDKPLEQSHGSFPFETIAVGSAQHDWLKDELESDATKGAEHVVVMLHESPQTLGGNAMPHFQTPQRIEERDDAGNLIGVRYEYPADSNMVVRDVIPMLESGPVDLVFNGHNHVWNRFTSDNGTNYLETSNVGNTYGTFHEVSGKKRRLPGAPWNADNYLEQGSAAGLEPVVPSVKPFVNGDGIAEPYVQSNDVTVFSALDTEAGKVTSWAVDMKDPNATPYVMDEFTFSK